MEQCGSHHEWVTSCCAACEAAQNNLCPYSAHVHYLYDLFGTIPAFTIQFIPVSIYGTFRYPLYPQEQQEKRSYNEQGSVPFA